MAYIRKFKTGSGATGVQVCFKEGTQVVRTVHVGSATTERELFELMQEAQKVINGDAPTLFDLSKYDAKKPGK